MLPIIITAFVCVPAGFLIAGAFLVPNYKAAIEALDKSEANNSYWYNEYKLVRDREKSAAAKKSAAVAKGNRTQAAKRVAGK